MIQITKEEKQTIEKILPNACIVRTMKQHSERHRYYCEESDAAMRLIRDMRGGENVLEEREKYGRRKKRRRNSSAVS